MPRRKRSASPFDVFDEDFDEDASSTSSRTDQPPIQRNAANARERARMRVLSSAFCRLKTKLPNIPADTKLSKLDTLRLATIYIKQLKGIVDGEETSMASEQLSFPQPPQSLTWPFTFQNVQNYRLSSSQYSPDSSWPTSQPHSNKYSTEGYRNDGVDQMHHNNNNNINCAYGNYHHQPITHVAHTHHHPHQLNHNNGHSIH